MSAENRGEVELAVEHEVVDAGQLKGTSET